ncbi:MAG TPA: hypothetical protein VMV77_10265 [Bacteroidales bacterium]|nr:hypothetical protein [Bacteroidales bacterium]
MKRYTLILVLLLLSCIGCVNNQSQIILENVAPGVIKMLMGKPDQFSPYQYCPEKPMIQEMKELSKKKLPFDLDSSGFC